MSGWIMIWGKKGMGDCPGSGDSASPQAGRSTPQFQRWPSRVPVMLPPRSNRHSQSFPDMHATTPARAGVQEGISSAWEGPANIRIRRIARSIAITVRRTSEQRVYVPARASSTTLSVRICGSTIGCAAPGAQYRYSGTPSRPSWRSMAPIAASPRVQSALR